MTKFLQIVLLIVVVLWFEINGKPLFQGISFQRGFEINFKPLPRKPISFIKEKWSPFGTFGRKHEIQKRNSGGTMVPAGQAAPVVPLALGVQEPRPAAPVFEQVEEEHLHTPPLITLPHETPRSVIPILTSSPIPPPISPGPAVVSSPAPPPPLSVIVSPVPHPVVSNVPPPSIAPDEVNMTPNKPITSNEPLQAPPIPIEESISTNMVIPPPAGRFTDILRSEPVREFMDSIQPIPPPLAVEEKAAPPLETNSIRPEPPKNDIVINENSLIRGSRLALYFGSIFLQLVSQFMTNARATLDQMTNPPPIYNN